MKVYKVLAVIALLVAFGAPQVAEAGMIKGEVWRVDGGASSPAAFVAAGPTINPDVTFTFDEFTFDSRNAADTTLKSFLETGLGWADITALTAKGTTMLGQVASEPSSTTDAYASFFRFTGSANFVNKTYTFVKDDGFKLFVNGSEFFDASSPTAPATVTKAWTLAPGVYSFEMLYGEWNGLPAVMTADLQAVPEPASMLLLGTGLLGIGRAWRKRRG